MYDDLTSLEHKPIPKILQITKQFWKTPNFRSKDMKCMIKKRIKDLTNEEEQDQGWKTLGNEVWSEREEFGRWKDSKQSREIEVNRFEIARRLYIENS